MPIVLIIEDNRENQQSYNGIVSIVEKELNFYIDHRFASNFVEAQEALEDGLTNPKVSPALILLDMEMPYEGHQDNYAGYRIMELYRWKYPNAYWVPLTAVLNWQEKKSAENSSLFDKLYRLQPFDVFSKGGSSESQNSGNLKSIVFDAMELIKKASESKQSQEQKAMLETANTSVVIPLEIQGQQFSWVLPTYKLYREIRTIAEGKHNILLFGEPGTGKMFTAQAIHYYSGLRDDAFRVLDGKTDAALIEKMLFPPDPNEKVVYGFEALLDQVRDGTLYISDFDQLGGGSEELSLRMQRRLRHYLVYRHYNVRIIGGINKKRKDFVTFDMILPEFLEPSRAVDIPSLNERKSDIPAFVEIFLEEFNRRHQDQPARKFVDQPKIYSLLQSQDWQDGNITQLRSVLDEALLRTHDPVTIVTAKNLKEVLDASVRAKVLRSVDIISAGEKTRVNITRQPFVVSEEDLRVFGVG